MKKFKYPLRITGTTTQIASLFEDLTKLGYTTYHQHLDLEGDNRNVNLVTNDAETNGKLRVYNDDIFDSDIVRTVVPASNKDLVLALAAMVDDDKPHVGEWIIPVDSSLKEVENGKLFRINKLVGPRDGFDVDGYESNNPYGGAINMYSCRKATKEEIFAHFDKPDLKEIKVGDIVVIERCPFNTLLKVPQTGVVLELNSDISHNKTKVKVTIPPSDVPTGLLYFSDSDKAIRKATKEEIAEHIQNTDDSLVPDFTANQIIKTRLETLLEDHPDLQEDLAELFPEVIEKPDYRGEVDITDKGVTFNGNPAAWLRGSGNHEGVSLYLCQNYNWEIVTDSEGEQVLLPTHKK